MKYVHKPFNIEKTFLALHMSSEIRFDQNKIYDPWDRDDHFCPECQIGRDILKANPDLLELASRWQFEGDEYQVRFDLLAKYLVEKGSGFDDHFTGQADSCGICHIDYKYIIKLETLHEGI